MVLRADYNVCGECSWIAAQHAGRTRMFLVKHPQDEANLHHSPSWHIPQWSFHKQWARGASPRRNGTAAPTPGHQHTIHWDLGGRAPKEECPSLHKPPSHSEAWKYMYKNALPHLEGRTPSRRYCAFVRR